MAQLDGIGAQDRHRTRRSDLTTSIAGTPAGSDRGRTERNRKIRSEDRTRFRQGNSFPGRH